jgi:hypothetical protein
MCFYAYAPNQVIDIPYKSEYIALESDGTSIVLVDFLIKNKSNEAIQKIKIIYPNRLYKIKKRGKNKGEPKEGYSKVFFINKTHTFEVTVQPPLCS